MKTFWHRWLQVVSLFLVGYGLGLVLIVLPPLDLPVRFALDIALLPLTSGADGLDSAARLMTAVSGAMLAGWGIMIWFAVTCGLDRPGMDWVRRSLISSLLAWFALDTAASIVLGALANAGMNLLLALLLLAPLWQMARSADNRPAIA